MTEGLFTDGVLPGPDDVIIALMGMTGAGKSSLIALCSDKKPEIGHDLTSCTDSVGTYSFVYPGPPKKTVFLVDTPGFDDSSRSDTEILRLLTAWLASAFAQDLRLSGIIYLHRVNQPRMQGSAVRNIGIFKSLCGDDALKNVILATTMWDLVSEEEGVAREKQLVETGQFWGYMASKGSTTYRHLNTYESAMKLIGHFVKADKVTLDIQQEMVVEHKRLDSTAAGAAVEARLKEQEERFSAEIRELHKELREAKEAKDHDTSEALEGVLAESKAEIAQLKESYEKLHVNMEKLLLQQQANKEGGQKTTGKSLQPRKMSSPASAKAIETATTVVVASRPSRKAQQKPVVPTMVPRTPSGLWSTRISPDGSFLSVMTGDGLFGVWSTETGQCKWVRRDPSGYKKPYYHSQRINADSTLYVDDSEHGPVRVFDTSSGSLVCTFTRRSPQDSLVSAEWSGDGGEVLAVSRKSEKAMVFEAWDVQTTQKTMTFDLQHATRNRLWTYESGRLVTMEEGRPLEIWDARTGHFLQTSSFVGWPQPDDQANRFTWSPDMQSIALAMRSGIQIWSISTGLCIQLPESKPSLCALLKWSNDGTLIASETNSNKLIIWDAQRGTIVSKHDNEPGFMSMQLRFSHDGTMLAAKPRNAFGIALWNTRPRLSRLHSVPISSLGVIPHELAWLRDEKKIVYVTGREINVWDVAAGKRISPYNQLFSQDLGEVLLPES